MGEELGTGYQPHRYGDGESGKQLWRRRCGRPRWSLPPKLL